MLGRSDLATPASGPLMYLGVYHNQATKDRLSGSGPSRSTANGDCPTEFAMRTECNDLAVRF